MTGKAKMARDQSVIAEFKVSVVLWRSVSQATSHLTDVQRRAERERDAVIDVARTVGKGVSDNDRDDDERL